MQTNNSLVLKDSSGKQPNRLPYFKGITGKLLLAFLSIALLPLLLVASVSYAISATALNAEVINNLRSITKSKAELIEGYSRERKRDVTVLAGDPTLRSITDKLVAASVKSGTRSSAYRFLLEGQRTYLSYFAEQGKYIDIFLISADGNLLFSLRQAQDIGTNYYTGKYKTTPLAKVFDSAKTLIETEISDFGDYPSPKEPAAFVAAPVFNDGIVIGVVAIQLNNVELFAVVNDTNGLGETGETIIGRVDDYSPGQVQLPIPSRFDGQPDKPVASRDIPVGSPLIPLQKAVLGDRGDGNATDLRGQEVVGAWRYLPSLRWGMFVKKDMSEAFAPIQNLRNSVFVLLLLTLVAVGATAVSIAGTISDPILRLTMAVRALSKGDLSARASDITSHDEIRELATGFNEMATQLSGMVNTLEDRVKARTQELEQQAVQLNEARNAAEAANLAKSQFLANMSHELRTPLNAILGFTQVMERDSSLKSKNREHLAIILRSGDHLLGLINDVLEMSKIEAGQSSLNLSAMDLHELFHGLEDLFHNRAEVKKLQLLIECDPSVPRYVNADESKLRQILINLLGNAVKFTTEGGIALRARYHDGQLDVEVEDTGEGISEADQKKLFQAFVQTGTGKRTDQGTGLGLAITRQFVQLMGGTINVRSTVGHGSVFFFHVKLDIADLTVAAERQVRRKVIGIDGPPDKKYRILVVDDKWENRRLMIEWMEQVGFETREATNGQQAVEQWETWEPHLIWMDMRMPIMDGYEATRRIKANIKGQATVIIALTASAFEHERSIVLSAGCDDFVRKPAPERIIFEKITQHLGIKFIYEEMETGPNPNQPESNGNPLTPETLRALPTEWLTDLSTAADEIDVELAQAVVTKIRSKNAQLADALTKLIASYRFDQIQTLIDQTNKPEKVE